MLHGCVGYTAELPAYSETTCVAATYGLWGLADYVAANKESYFADLAEIYGRGIENRNSDAEVGPWLVDAHDKVGAEAEIFRPAHTGEGENGQFFPECYLIPLDAENQTNLQAAFEMIDPQRREGQHCRFPCNRGRKDSARRNRRGLHVPG